MRVGVDEAWEDSRRPKIDLIRLVRASPGGLDGENPATVDHDSGVWQGRTSDREDPRRPETTHTPGRPSARRPLPLPGRRPGGVPRQLFRNRAVAGSPRFGE